MGHDSWLFFFENPHGHGMAKEAASLDDTEPAIGSNLIKGGAFTYAEARGDIEARNSMKACGAISLAAGER